MGKLDWKVAIVTGAARGLGRTYAKRLAGLGAKVAVTDINLHWYEEFEAEAKDMTGDSTVAEIEATGGTAIGIEVDVTDHAVVAGDRGDRILPGTPSPKLRTWSATPARSAHTSAPGHAIARCCTPCWRTGCRVCKITVGTDAAVRGSPC
jgi:hypothetical protein